jgi:hypothetical protein
MASLLIFTLALELQNLAFGRCGKVVKCGYEGQKATNVCSV